MKAPAAELDAGKFVGFWKRFVDEVGPSVYKLPATIDREELSRILTKVMKMTLVTGVDKEPGNLYAAAVFHTVTRSENGQPVTIPCFLRIETKPGIPLIRFTAHSGHKLVSQGLAASVVSITSAQEHKR